LRTTQSAVDAEKQVLTAAKLRRVAECCVLEQRIAGPLTQPYVREDGGNLSQKKEPEHYTRQSDAKRLDV